MGSVVCPEDVGEKFLACPGKMVFLKLGTANNHQSSSTTPQEVLHLLLLNIEVVASSLSQQTYRFPPRLVQPICISRASNHSIHKKLWITNEIIMPLTVQHQYTFPQVCNRNSMHLTLEICHLHYPKTYSMTSSMVPMPLELYNWG